MYKLKTKIKFENRKKYENKTNLNLIISVSQDPIFE